jgi:hypothetical protein
MNPLSDAATIARSNVEMLEVAVHQRLSKS